MAYESVHNLTASVNYYDPEEYWSASPNPKKTYYSPFRYIGLIMVYCARKMRPPLKNIL